MSEPVRDDLGAEKVSDLLATALTAVSFGAQNKTAEVLGTLFREGSKVDVLAFVSGCLFAIRDALPDGVTAELGWYEADGGVSLPSEGAVLPAPVVLASQCLGDFLGGAPATAWQRWLDADDKVAAGCVGVLLRQAAELMRSANARLN